RRSVLGAKANGSLQRESLIAMNRGQLIGVAKAYALRLLEAGFQPPEKAQITVAGQSGHLGIMTMVNGEHAAGRLTETDVRLAAALLTVLTGGSDGDPLKPLSEEEAMALERKSLLELIKTPETKARIDHMLKTGKPLKN